MINAMERFKLRQMKTEELKQKPNEEIPKPLDISSMRGTNKYVDILKEYALKNAYDICNNEKFSEKDTENYIANVKKDIDNINIENADTAYLKCINKIFNIVGNANFRYKYENKRKEILENKQKIETNNIVPETTKVESEERDFQLISEKAEKIFANADRKLEKIKKKFKLHDQKTEENAMGAKISGINISNIVLKNNVFGNIYIAICIAGESAGFLPEALGYLLTLLKKQDTLKGKFIQMSIYPSILVTILVGVFFLMGGFVFPKLISGLSITDPPFMVSILTGSVSFISHYWLLIVLFLVGLCYFINSIFGFDHIKKAYSDFLMKIPFLSDCIKYFSLAHYMSVMHIAYEAGIPITESLKMAESTITNDEMRKRAKDVANLISQGKSLTDAYYQSQLIPGVLMPLIATGEKTGKLGQMFRDASIGIEKKLDLALDALARAFEPLLMVVLGGCVGYFVIAFVQMYSEAMSSLLNLF